MAQAFEYLNAYKMWNADSLTPKCGIHEYFKTLNY